jgi:hypothetical protein
VIIAGLYHKFGVEYDDTARSKQEDSERGWPIRYLHAQAHSVYGFVYDLSRLAMALVVNEKAVKSLSKRLLLGLRPSILDRYA